MFHDLVLVFFSDEACFTLNANFNNRSGYWHSENLFAIHEVTLYEFTIRVWCALRVYIIIEIVLYNEMVNST